MILNRNPKGNGRKGRKESRGSKAHRGKTRSWVKLLAQNRALLRRKPGTAPFKRFPKELQNACDWW